MIKTNGATWKRFYNDDSYWKEEFWHEDEEIEIDGKLHIDGDKVVLKDLKSIGDESVVKIKSGVVYLDENDLEKNISLEKFFRDWQKKQDEIILVVKCNKNNVEIIRESIIHGGGKII